jgi:hypothetical protein
VEKPAPDSELPGEAARKIIISTSPAELLMTTGLPDFRPIQGTALQYAADTDSQLFFHTKERQAYLLVSGRWFKGPSLQGPWNYVAPRDLPPDFAKIPAGSPQAVVLASVPGTRQAELAIVANSAPTTATVSRSNTTIQLTFDGEPKFKAIEGTDMEYAINAQLPVIKADDQFFALDNGVWFVAASAHGPWKVATEVPEKVYTIPPSSPVYYATFARVYDSDEETVEVGYTPGYVGAYEEDGTMVYGTGWEYEPWYGEEYYGWGWTWGYSYVYVPWYQWWVWRPWWGARGGLRAAVIDNIYHRWTDRPGVMPHQRAAPAGTKSLGSHDLSGYPALYGRFRGARNAAPLTPPAGTLALNPYSRPQTPVRSGDVPRGAQLLSSLRQSPGGGQDLYASPDGSIYRRKNDGWYRRQSTGKWDYFAPLQGNVQANQAGSPRGTQLAAAAASRGSPSAYAPAVRNARADRVPNVGSEARAHEVAALEREYYARALNQLRTQNVRPAAGSARAARGGGRRR